MLFEKPRPWLAWTLLLAPALALAEVASPPGQPITLDVAIERSLASNPELAAFAPALRASDGQRLQASLGPNPEFGLTIEDALGTGDRRGVSSAQTTLSIRQIFERGAATRRVGVVDAGRELLDAQLAEQRLDVAAETARRYLRVLADQSRLDVAGDAVALAAQAVAAAEERVNAAKAPDAELSRALADQARVELDLEDAEHELLVSRRQLAALWGDAEARFGEATGDLLSVPRPEPFERLASRIAANPSLLKFGSEIRLREAELRLAEQRAKPAFELSAGLRRFEVGNDVAAVFGLSLPLALNDRGQGAIASARAGIEQVDANRAAIELRIRTHLFALFQGLQHARHVVDALDGKVLPRVSEALTLTEYAYTRGRYGYLELIAAQRDLLAARRARIQAAVDAHGFATEIDRLTGSLPGTATTERAAP